MMENYDEKFIKNLLGKFNMDNCIAYYLRQDFEDL